MNIETGQLLRLIGSSEEQEVMIREAGEDFLRIPEELEAEARQQLGNKKETFVPLNKPSSLADWAAKARAEQSKKKAKRKMIKASKRRNR
jgi:TRAP-type C4-dicarboxylate transport system substrate-binding protein